MFFIKSLLFLSIFFTLSFSSGTPKEKINIIDTVISSFIGDTTKENSRDDTDSNSKAMCYALTDNRSKLYKVSMLPNGNPLPISSVVNISSTFNGEGSAYRASNNKLYAFKSYSDGQGPSDLYTIDVNTGAINRVSDDIISGSVDGAEFYFDPTLNKEILYIISGEYNSKLYAFDTDNWRLLNGYPKDTHTNLSSLAINPTTGEAYAIDDYNYDQKKPKVYKLNLKTGDTTQITTLQHLADAEGLAFASDGNLYVEDEGRNDLNGKKLYMVNLQTGALTPSAITDISGDIEGLSCNGTQIYQNRYTFSGYIFNDKNHNQIKDSNENGLKADSYIKLCTLDNTFIKSTKADKSTGAYTIDNITAGEYKLLEDASNSHDCTTSTDVSGFISTTPNIINIEINSTNLSNKNFGNYHGSKISGMVFDDKDKDGHKDSNEKGIANVKLVIKRCGNIEFDNTVTDSNGSYSFWVPVGVQGDYSVDGWIGVFETDLNDYNSTGDEFDNGKGNQNEQGDAQDDHNWLCFSNRGVDFDNGGYNLVGNNFGDIKEDNGVPFTCSANAYIFTSHDSKHNPTDVYITDISSGSFNLAKEDINPTNINAIGYNIIDNYIWGYDKITQEVKRVDSNYSIKAYTIANLPEHGYHAGDVSADGVLYLYTKFFDGGKKIYKVDVNPNSTNYLKMVGVINLSQKIDTSDFAFHPLDNKLYYASANKLYRINPSNGIIEELGSLELNDQKVFIGTFFDNEGYFYIQEGTDGGGSGKVYRIDITDPTNPKPKAVAFSTFMVTSYSDGARCANASMPPPQISSGTCYGLIDNGKSIYEMDLTSNSASKTININQKFVGEGTAYRSSNHTLYTFQTYKNGSVDSHGSMSTLYSIDLNSSNNPISVVKIKDNIVSDEVEGAEFYYDSSTEKEILYILTSKNQQKNTIKLHAFYADEWSNELNGYPKSVNGVRLDSLAIDPHTHQGYATDDAGSSTAPKIYKLDLDTGVATLIFQADKKFDAEGLAFASDGNLYTEDEGGYSGLDRKIYRVDLQQQKFIEVRNLAGNKDIEGLSCNGIASTMPPELLELSINNITKLEGDSGFTDFDFVVSLNKPAPKGGITIQYKTKDGTAKDEDFSDDNESILPKVSISDAVATESDSSNKKIKFDVILDKPAPNGGVIVQVQPHNITAIEGEDYSRISSSIYIAEGKSKEKIEYNIIGDDISEETETFKIELFNPQNAILDRAYGIGTIKDNDSENNQNDEDSDNSSSSWWDILSGWMSSFSKSSNTNNKQNYHTPKSASIGKKDKTQHKMEKEQESSDKPQENSQNKTTSLADYQKIQGSITINEGEQNATIHVSVNGDNEVEDNETFYVVTLPPIGINSIVPIGIGTIINDDNETNTTQELEPFSCSERLYLSNRSKLGTGSSDSGKSWLHSIDQNSTPYKFNSIGDGFESDNGGYNALGYNPKDNFMYALYKTHLLKIDKNATVVDLGEVDGVTTQLYAGAFDRNGSYYVSGNGGADDKLYKIDISQRKVVQTLSLRYSMRGKNEAVKFWDMTIDKSNQYLYAMLIDNSDDTKNDKLVKIDKDTGIMSVIKDKPTGLSSAVDTLFSDIDGDLFLLEHTNGFYKIDTTSGEIYKLSSTDELTYYNDGANCVDANISEPSTVSIQSKVVGFEGDSGSTKFTFDISFTKSAPADAGFWVTFTDGVDAISPTGTAQHIDSHPDDGDFGGEARYIQIPEGTTHYEINATVYGDIKIEPDEEFYVDLYDPSNLAIKDSRGVGVIINDDYVRFNIERVGSDSITPTNEAQQQQKESLYTQIAGRDFDYAIVSYDKNQSNFQEYPVENITLKIELIDNNSTTPEEVLYTHYKYLDHKSSRFDITDEDRNELKLRASRDVIFKISYLEQNQSIVQGDFTSNTSIFDNNSSVKVAYSRDNFAIRPASYYVAIGDTNNTIYATNSSNQQAINLASEYRYNLIAKALKYDGTQVATHYTTYSPQEINATIIFNDTTNSLACANENNITINSNYIFQNGELQNAKLSHNNVGPYYFHIIDTNWTRVDRFNPNQIGCVENSSSNNPNEDLTNQSRVGCNFDSSWRDGFKDIDINFQAYQFNLKNTTIKNRPDNGKDYIYMGDLGSSLDMGLNIYTDIIAEGKDGTKLTNFTKSCVAKDVAISLNYNITNELYNNATTYNRLYTTQGSEVKFRKIVSHNGLGWDINSASETHLDNNITVGANKFLDINEGNSSINILYNINKNLSETINPIKIRFNSLEANSTSSISKIENKNRVTPKSVGSGVLNSTKTFYYSAIIPDRENYPDSFTNSISTPIGVYIYCDFNRTMCNDMIGNNGLNSFKTQIGWYLAIKHNSLTDGTVNPSSLDSVTVTPNPIPNFNQGRRGRIELQTNYTGGTIPINSSVDTEVSINPSPWLKYHSNPARNGNPFWKNRFRGDIDGTMTGVGKTGKVLEIKANRKKTNRMDW